MQHSLRKSRDHPDPRTLRSRSSGVPLASSDLLLRQENFPLRENCSMATKRTLASHKTNRTVPARPRFAPLPPKQPKNPDAFPRRILQKPDLPGIKRQPRQQNRNHPQTRRTTPPLRNSTGRRRTRQLNRPYIAAATLSQPILHPLLRIPKLDFISKEENAPLYRPLSPPSVRPTFSAFRKANEAIPYGDRLRQKLQRQSKPQQNPTLVDIQPTASKDALLELLHG